MKSMRVSVSVEFKNKKRGIVTSPSPTTSAGEKAPRLMFKGMGTELTDEAARMAKRTDR